MLLKISHEYAHALDGCSYHAAWSPKKYFGFGRVLRYSHPDDMQKTLVEFPFREKILCQPREIRNSKMLNNVRDSRWSIMCSHKSSEEFFADVLGTQMFFQSYKKSIRLSELAKVFCPVKGNFTKFVNENGKIVARTSITWLEAADRPDFEYRYSILYSAAKKANRIDSLELIPKYNIDSCF